MLLYSAEICGASGLSTQEYQSYRIDWVPRTYRNADSLPRLDRAAANTQPARAVRAATVTGAPHRRAEHDADVPPIGGRYLMTGTNAAGRIPNGSADPQGAPPHAHRHANQTTMTLNTLLTATGQLSQPRGRAVPPR